MDAFLDEMDLPLAALVGNSMGGTVSLIYAMDNPRRVSRLVLIGSPVYPDNVPTAALDHAPARHRPHPGAAAGPLDRQSRGAHGVLGPLPRHRGVSSRIFPGAQAKEGRHAVAETLRRCLSPELAGTIARYRRARAPGPLHPRRATTAWWTTPAPRGSAAPCRTGRSCASRTAATCPRKRNPRRSARPSPGSWRPRQEADPNLVSSVRLHRPSAPGEHHARVQTLRRP